jgi:hypothetical protein
MEAAISNVIPSKAWTGLEVSRSLRLPALKAFEL